MGQVLKGIPNTSCVAEGMADEERLKTFILYSRDYATTERNADYAN